jgi:hypothetical protein
LEVSFLATGDDNGLEEEEDLEGLAGENFDFVDDGMIFLVRFAIRFGFVVEEAEEEDVTGGRREERADEDEAAWDSRKACMADSERGVPRISRTKDERE